MFEVNLFDVASRRSMTQAHLDSLGKVAFYMFPLELAVKQVRGKGTHKLAIFEDPNYGYCKRLHQSLEKVDDITIYSFLYPVLDRKPGVDSCIKSRNIWRAKDPAKSLSDWMHHNKVPDNATCEEPSERVAAMGRKLLVRGTPAIFFRMGTGLMTHTLSRKS